MTDADALARDGATSESIAGVRILVDVRDDRTGTADASRLVAAMLRAEVVRALAPAGGSVAPGYPGRLLVGPRTLPHARPGDVVWGGGLGDALERRLVAVDGVDHRGAAGPMADRAIREAGGDASLGVVGDPLLLLGDVFPERVGDRGAAAGIGVVADVDDAEIEAVEGARRIVLEEDPWRSAEALAGCASIVTSSADVLAIADGLGVPVRLVRDAGTLRAHLDDHALATGRGRTALAASVAEAMQDEPLAPAAFDAEALRAAFPAELWRTPRVSVVVPTANVATWVDECLDSLMTQELDDLEVIVVDDRSSDDTVALARAAARRDRRIRVVAGAVAGGGSARNLGVDLARGEYLAFADGDDLVPEGAYRALTEAGDRSGSDLVLGRFLKFSASKTWDPTRSWSVFKEDREAVDLVGEPSIIRGRACWNKLYRASWFRDEGIRFPDVPRSNDIVPVVTAYVRARTIDIVRDRVYLYRDRPGGTSMTAKAGQLRGLRSYLTQECLCLDLVRGTGDARLLDEYTRMIVQSDGWVLVTRVLEALTESSPEDEAAIADRMRALLGGLSPDALATLPMERAIVFSLIASGDLRGAKAAHAEHNLLDAARAIGGLERLVAASDALDTADADPALHSVLALASARVALAEVQSRARDAASAAAAVASIASRAPEDGPRRDPRMGVVVEASLAGRHGVLERLSAVGGGGVVARTARRLGGGVQVEGEAPVALAGARLTVLAEPDAGGPVRALGQIEISDVEGEGSWSFAIGPGALADGVWRLQIAAGDDAAGPEAAFLSRLRWSAQPFSETSSRADRVAVHGRVGERYEVKLHAFPAAPRRAARAVARRLDPRLQRVVARAITGARSAAGRIQPSSASEANRAGD